MVAKLSTIRNGPTLPVQSDHAPIEAYCRHGPTASRGCFLQLTKVFHTYSTRVRHRKSRREKAMSFNNNNYSDFLCAKILEDQAQWREKTKGLSKLVIVKQCVNHQWMDEEARRLRRIGSIKEIDFRRRRNETILPFDLTLAGSEFHTVGNRESSGQTFVFTRGM